MMIHLYSLCKLRPFQEIVSYILFQQKLLSGKQMLDSHQYRSNGLSRSYIRTNRLMVWKCLTFIMILPRRERRINQPFYKFTVVQKGKQKPYTTQLFNI